MNTERKPEERPSSWLLAEQSIVMSFYYQNVLFVLLALEQNRNTNGMVVLEAYPTSAIMLYHQDFAGPPLNIL